MVAVPVPTVHYFMKIYYLDHITEKGSPLRIGIGVFFSEFLFNSRSGDPKRRFVREGIEHRTALIFHLITLLFHKFADLFCDLRIKIF